MFVLCSVLLVVVQICQATPLHLEINHRNPETGEIENTSRFEIDDDFIGEGNLQLQISPLSQEIDPSVMEYYFDCSMPIPPPLIENSDYDRAVRQAEPPSGAVFDTALAGINGIALNVLNVGFSLYNRIRS